MATLDGSDMEALGYWTALGLAWLCILGSWTFSSFSCQRYVCFPSNSGHRVVYVYHWHLLTFTCVVIPYLLYLSSSPPPPFFFFLIIIACSSLFQFGLSLFFFCHNLFLQAVCNLLGVGVNEAVVNQSSFLVSRRDISTMYYCLIPWLPYGFTCSSASEPHIYGARNIFFCWLLWLENYYLEISSRQSRVSTCSRVLMVILADI